MRQTLLSLALLTMLSAVTGCNALCGCGWHGVCDCTVDDQCIMREPWVAQQFPVEGAIVPDMVAPAGPGLSGYQMMPAAPANTVAPTPAPSAPAAPVRPMSVPASEPQLPRGL